MADRINNPGGSDDPDQILKALQGVIGRLERAAAEGEAQLVQSERTQRRLSSDVARQEAQAAKKLPPRTPGPELGRGGGASDTQIEAAERRRIANEERMAEKLRERLRLERELRALPPAGGTGGGYFGGLTGPEAAARAHVPIPKDSIQTGIPGTGQALRATSAQRLDEALHKAGRAAEEAAAAFRRAERLALPPGGGGPGYGPAGRGFPLVPFGPSQIARLGEVVSAQHAQRLLPPGAAQAPGGPRFFSQADAQREATTAQFRAAEAMRRTAESIAAHQRALPPGPQLGPDYARDVRDKFAMGPEGSERVADAKRREGEAFRYSTRAVGQNENAMLRHGYATSEFITATVRGTVTARQLGEQIVGTTAKFGLWTAAATAVYGTVAALARVGHGAIDAETAVNKLSRVTTNLDTGRARKELVALSKEFNLPIDQVGDAAYGMAKVFRDQNDIFKSTRQALFAVKVGELEAGEATRYLTSIVSGLGGSAKDLPAVFDAINQAQNRFGGNTGNMVAGVAKSIGIFKTAGGTYQELIALLRTGSKLTGVTENEVATAVSRSASRVLTPQGQKALKEAGLTPGQDFNALLLEAMQKAQGASGERVNQLARAFVPAGGQFARIFAPILQNRELYQKILNEVTNNSEGSANRELEKVLRSPAEQLTKMGNALERLGVAAGQTGLLVPFVALVKALTTAIDLSADLLNVFRDLAGPLAPVLGIWLQIAAATKLARRFDVGGHLPAGAPGAQYLARPAGQLERAAVLQSADFHMEGVREELRAAARGVRSSVLRRDRLRAELAGAVGRHGPVEVDDAGQYTGPHREVVDAQRRLDTQERKVAEQIAIRNALVDEEIATQKGINNFQRQTNAKNITVSQVQRAAVFNALAYSSPSLEQGGLPKVLPTIPGFAREAPFVSQQPYGPFRQGEAPPPPTFRQSAATSIGNMRAATTAAYENTRVAQRMSVSTRVLDTGIRGMGRGVAGMGRGMGSMAAGLGRGVASLAAALGPLDLLIGAVLSTMYALDQFSDSSDRLDQLRKPSGDPAEMQRRADAIENRNRGIFNKGFDWATTTGAKFDRNVLAPVSRFFGSDNPAADTQGPREREEAEAANLRAEAASLKTAQSRGRLRLLGDIKGSFDREFAAATSAKERRQVISKYLEQESASWANTYGSEADKAKSAELARYIDSHFATISTVGSNLRRALDAIDTPEKADVANRQLKNDIAFEGVTPNNQRRASGLIARYQELAAIAPDDQAEKYLQMAQDVEDSIMNEADAHMKRLVAAARTPREEGAARQQYLQTARATIGERSAGHRDRLGRLREIEAQREKDEDAAVKDVQRARRAEDAAKQGPGLDRFGQIGPDSLTQKGSHQLPGDALKEATTAREGAEAELAGIRAGGKNNRGRIRKLKEILKKNDQKIKDLEREMAVDQAEAELEAFDAKTELGAARIRDPGDRARYQADRAKQRVGQIRELVRKGIKKQKDLDRAVADWLSKQEQAEEEAITDFQSQQQLGSAQFALSVGGNPGAIVQDAIAKARQFVGFLRRKGVTGRRMNDALTALANAELAGVQYVKEQAAAMLQAQEAYTIAGIDPADTVAIAKVRERYARLRAQRTPGQTPAERKQQAADIRQSEAERRRAQQQDVYDEQQFQHEMGRITDRAYIAWLKDFAKTIKNNKALKRQVQLQAKQLEDSLKGDNDLTLNLDNLRLPTTYEIRRALSPAGQRQPNVQVTNAPKVDVHVYSEGDVPKVIEALDLTLNTSGRSALRSSGVIR